MTLQERCAVFFSASLAVFPSKRRFFFHPFCCWLAVSSLNVLLFYDLDWLFLLHFIVERTWGKIFTFNFVSFSCGFSVLPAIRKWWCFLQDFWHVIVTAFLTGHFIFSRLAPAGRGNVPPSIDSLILHFTFVTACACSWTENKNVLEQACFHYQV